MFLRPWVPPHPPRILCRGIFVLWLRAGGRSCNVAFSLSPSVPPLHFSPWAGEPLWAGWVTGEPPKSASVTAEAGKLPTLRVRPFWPFQVAVSRLPSMIVMGSPGSIRKAPGSVTSLTQRPSESQAWAPCHAEHGMQETTKETLVSVQGDPVSSNLFTLFHSKPTRSASRTPQGQAHGSDRELFLSLLPPSHCLYHLPYCSQA